MSRTVIIVIAGLILLAGIILLSGSRTPRSPADTPGGHGLAPSSSRIGNSALSHGSPATDRPARRKADDEPRSMPNAEGGRR